MSSPTAGQTPSTPPSDLNSILEAALNEYKKTTGGGLLEHPLAEEVKECDSIGAISAVLQCQARGFQQFKDGDQRLMKWIDPMVDALSTFSETLGGAASIAFPPAGVVFAGIGVLLSAAKDVRTSHDALIELFERIESFFKRLGVYTQVSFTTEMAEVFVKIVAEVLTIISIATKEVKRKRAKIYFRKLLGRTDIEDAFKRLDSLIHEEVRMVIAQIYKATIEHKENLAKSNMTIAGKIDDVAKNTEELAKNAEKKTDQIANSMDEAKWNQVEQDILKWFSPPDPSTNHNDACEIYNNVPPTWFFRAQIFENWMSNGSLLWVHGKPGSGKSIFCSAVIQHIMKLRDAGNATLAYFYFDFRDEQKQNVRNVVTSLLVQLSAYSKPCCDIIYRLYSTLGKGMKQHQPTNNSLIDCPKEMLAILTQHPIFLVMDALDECPDIGMPTPREAVLSLIKDLVCLHLQVPNLHIFVTSRPEADIQTRLKPLAIFAISLQEESRQKALISSYISSVVSSDERMKQWQDEDKRLVAKELSERADGMQAFQWVFCQLEMLRRTAQPNVRRILEKLPKTLDETYDRMLKNINENNQDDARRLLHCLAVSARPLRVEELAEIFTFDFDAAEGSIPKFHPDRRPRNQEHAILSICSSLIAIVGNRGSRVVQFSHLSVKEFLTSSHLASSTGYLSSYRILPGPAHTILAQACLGLLLQSNDRSHNDSVGVSPLAKYAAQHWVTHAQFEDVASCVIDGMELLFDPDKAHFSVWIDLYDIDTESGGKFPSERPRPLYYSVLCGFGGLTRHIALKHPQDVNAIGGSYGFPIVAALCQNHFLVAELLLELGGRVDVRDARKETMLHKTIDRHDGEAIGAVKFLLERGVDVNAKRNDLWTPLHLAFHVGKLKAAQILLDHHADFNARTNDGQAPLHLLSRWKPRQDEDDGSDVANQLLECGANVNEKDSDNATPLHLASYYKRLEMVRILLDNGANIHTENDKGKTPLQMAIMGKGYSQSEGVSVARLLLAHGAEAYARDMYPISTSDLGCSFRKEKIAQVLFGNEDLSESENSWDEKFRLWIEECGVGDNVHDMYETILLHSASYQGMPEVVEMLLNYGVKLNAKNHWGEIVLHVVSRGRQDSLVGLRIAELLLKRGVDVNTRRMFDFTPLHVASCFGKLEIVRLLLDHGADANAETDNGLKLLHQVSFGLYKSKEDGVRIAELLLEHGAEVDARSEDHSTPLHIACEYGRLEIVRLLLDHGAEVNAEIVNGLKPLHEVSSGKYRSQGNGVRVAQLLLEHGADVNTRRNDHRTPLHIASYFGNVEIVHLLLNNGADPEANAEDDIGEKPLHKVSYGEYRSQGDGVRVAQLLLEHGADVNTRRNDHRTPLHAASHFGNVEIVRLLLDHGADPEANAEGSMGSKPLHEVSYGKYRSQENGVRVIQLLLEHGADVNTRRNDHWTPLHVASYSGNVEIVRLLLDHGADPEASAEGDMGVKPLHQVSYGKYRSEEDGVRVAKLLLERSADVNTRRNDNQTPLHLASYFGNVEIVRLLLDHGADPEANAEGSMGSKPLHEVSYGKYKSLEDGVRVAQLLLERGADVNTRRNDHWTPLHIASYFGNAEIARLLLDHGADPEANAGGRLGEKPLHQVSYGECRSEEECVRVAQLLLEHGADVNTRRSDRQTPLHLASYYGNVEVVRLLLDHGADLEANVEGEKPLHKVSSGKYRSEEDGVRVAQLLLEHGADVNTRRNDCWTPLHIASYLGKFGIVQILIDHSAEVEAVDDFGKTPLHDVSQGKYESQEDDVRIAQLLLDHGADVNAKSWAGDTPMTFASYHGRLKLAELLEHAPNMQGPSANSNEVGH